MKVISFTKSTLPYGWMGNMCGRYKDTPLKITSHGLTWQSSESLFQALRFPIHSPLFKEMSRHSGWNAKKKVAQPNLDKQVILHQSMRDVSHMIYVVYLKLSQHPFLYQELLDTGDSIIIEDVSTRRGGSGLFWGSALVSGRWIGLNVLGEVLMLLRKDIEKGATLVSSMEAARILSKKLKDKYIWEN